MKIWGGYLAVISCDAAPYADALAAHCADVLLLPPCTRHDRRIAAHPDTLLAQLGDVLVTSAVYAAEAEAVFAELHRRCACRVIRAAYVPGRQYPADVGCNILACGRFAYALTAHLAAEVIAAAAEQGITLRNVRQGYAGCSALSCGGMIITADPSILRAAAADGVRTLAISPDGILLPGYDRGFIGGASGYAAGAAAFFGDIGRHPDGWRIAAALEAHGVEMISLADKALCDYGGIRFLRVKEEKNDGKA